MATYEGIYKCRLCGEEFKVYQMNKEVAQEEAHMISCGVNGRYGTQCRVVHECKDGSFGIGDCLGFRRSGWWEVR